jgi:hypothetical protein
LAVLARRWSPSPGCPPSRPDQLAAHRRQLRDGADPLLAGPVLARRWALLVALRPATPDAGPWQPEWFRACLVALVAVALLTWYGLARRRFGAWPLALGGLGWLAVLGLVLAAATPGGSYLAALPALAVALAGLLALAVRPDWLRLLVLALGGAVAILILAPTVLLFFPALGLATGGAAALFVAMLGLALLPVLDWLYPPRLLVPAPRPAPAPAPAPVAGAEDSSAMTTEGADSAEGGAGPSAGTRTRRPRRLRRRCRPHGGCARATFLDAGLSSIISTRRVRSRTADHALDTDTGQARWVSGDTSPERGPASSSPAGRTSATRFRSWATTSPPARRRRPACPAPCSPSSPTPRRGASARSRSISDRGARYAWSTCGSVMLRTR